MASVALTHHTIGAERGAIPLSTAGWTPPPGEKQRIERSLDPLPELDVDISPRPLRRQPAFIVSISLAVVAALGVGGWWAKQQFFSPPDVVEDLALLDGGQNYILEWRGPDVPYTVLVVHQDGEVQGDVSGWIKEWSVYMPKDYPELAADSCFVVQAADKAVVDAQIDLDNLDASGGGAICIADILKDENG